VLGDLGHELLEYFSLLLLVVSPVGVALQRHFCPSASRANSPASCLAWGDCTHRSAPGSWAGAAPRDLDMPDMQRSMGEGRTH
jgi:hypothetical protein